MYTQINRIIIFIVHHSPVPSFLSDRVAQSDAGMGHVRLHSLVDRGTYDRALLLYDVVIERRCKLIGLFCHGSVRYLFGPSRHIVSRACVGCRPCIACAAPCADVFLHVRQK